MNLRLPTYLLISSIAIFSCNKKKELAEVPNYEPLRVENVEEKPIQNSWKLDDFLTYNEALNQDVDALYNEMTTNELAAQMIALSDRIDIIYPDFDELMEDGIAGNILYLKLREKRILEIIEDHQNYPNGKTKTLFMADAEPSLMKYKFLDYKENIPNTIDIPFNEIDDYTLKIDKLLKKYHIKLNLGTVGDWGQNQAVINNRAWGKTPDEVIKDASEHIKIMQKDGIGATLKHFPGHGNIKGDSHEQLVKIDGELSELQNFKKIMTNSLPVAILTGHIAIENNGIYDSDLPTTLNPKIMKGLLRSQSESKSQNDMIFQGLIITDAMNMKAVRDIEDADYKSLEAGNDMVLIPKNPRNLHNRIREILEDQDHKLHIQFKQSVKRILKYKICTELIQS